MDKKISDSVSPRLIAFKLRDIEFSCRPFRFSTAYRLESEGVSLSELEASRHQRPFTFISDFIWGQMIDEDKSRFGSQDDWMDHFVLEDTQVLGEFCNDLMDKGMPTPTESTKKKVEKTRK